MPHPRHISQPASVGTTASGHRNVVDYNRFHKVPLLLHVGDAAGMPSTHATRVPHSHQRLLEEPFIDQRALDAQAILDRMHLLLLSKDKALRALHDARDQCAQHSMRLVASSDDHMAASMTDARSTEHAEYVAQGFAELRTAKELVEHAHSMFVRCDNDLRMAERELRMLYDSSELLCVAQDQDEERAELRYLADKDNGPSSGGQQRGGEGGGGHTPALSSDGLSLTPAAASAPLVDEAIERHTLERLNRDAQTLGMFDITLRMIRAPHTWGKTERGVHVTGLVVALQSGYRAYRTRRRYANLKKARRLLDRECVAYQFYFYRRYVAAVRLYRECLMRLGFYPLLGHANLASLRRGAFAMHATRAREHATVQRVFLLWRQLARYQSAPLLLPHNNFAPSRSSGGAPPVIDRSPTTAVNAATLSKSTSLSSVGALDPTTRWWERDAPCAYELPPWDVFLQQEHLRQAMKRIGLPVFGGASNRYIMCAHILKRWRRYVTVEKRVRAGWDVAVRHDRRSCRAKHFCAWMDVVSFTMQREAQAVAKTVLYFGVWRRLVQREKHERRAAAALVPLKKMQMLNRWRQRVVRLRLQRAASNLLIFAHRPIALYCMYAMLGRRQDAVFVKLWRWWRTYTMRRLNFKSLVGLGWEKRSKQLSRVVLLAWRGAVKGHPVDTPTRHATSPNAAHSPSMPFASGGLFAPTVGEFGEDIRLLDVRRSKEPLFKALHQTAAALDALGPPPTEAVARSGGSGGHVDAPMPCNPHDCFLPKEIGAVPSAHAMEQARQLEIRWYHQWHAVHTTAILVASNDRPSSSGSPTSAPSGVESPTSLHSSHEPPPVGWPGAQEQPQRRCPKDKHFLINFFVFAMQKNKRERQTQAYQQQQQTTTTETNLEATMSSEATAAGHDAAVASSSTSAAATASGTTAGAYSTRMLSFVLTVGAPLAQPATNEWNVQRMEAFFEDHCHYNYILQKKKEIRDGRIERKIDMRLAAIRFAEVNPFFTCHALSARNIGFSPYQQLLEEYTAASSNGKKRGSVGKKKKSVSSPVKKGKFRIPLPLVPVRRQLPFIVRAHLHQIVDSDDSQAHMLQQRYVRIKLQRAGLLMALAKRHPSTVDAARTEGIAAREVVLSRYVAAEEKDFTAAVVARKMHELVDPSTMGVIEWQPIAFQVLNLMGFNPKFLRGTMQQRTRRIGLIRAFMKAQGKFYFRTMRARCELLPIHQWAHKREELLDQQEQEAAAEAARDADAQLDGDDTFLQGPKKHQAAVDDLAEVDEDSESDDEEWRPMRTLSVQYLSEAVAVVERNETWAQVSRCLPASCPDSPMPRELVLRAPTPATPQAVEVDPEEAEGAALDGTNNRGSSVAFPSREATPRLAMDGDRAGSGFSPFATCAPNEDGSLGGIGLGDTDAELPTATPVPTSGEASRPSSGGSSKEKPKTDDETDGDLSTTDDDDDPRMVAARQLKPSGKPARTLAEREKGRRSILGSQSAAQMTSIARQPSVDHSQHATGGRRVSDDEEVAEIIGPSGGDGVNQIDATVDAFACAAIHNGPSDGADDQVRGPSEAATATVAEALEGGAFLLTNGAFQLADGSTIFPGPPARVALPTGETMESSAANNFSVTSDGRIRLSDGRVAPVGYVTVIDGLVQLQPGCLILADGSVIRVERGAYRIDGKVRLANGRLVDASRTAMGDNGKLMLATERFLVQQKAAGDADADASAASSSVGEEGRAALHRQQTGNALGTAGAGGSLFGGARRTNWRLACPRMWNDGALGAGASVPAMDRLMEISGRFNYYLNASTRLELDRLKHHVLRAIAKLDPAAAKADREAKAAERRIAALRSGGGHSGEPHHEHAEDNGVAPPPTGAVQPSEYVLPCVTIESARHHKAFPASAHVKGPATAASAGASGAHHASDDGAAAGGGGRAASAPSFFVPEGVALHKRIVGEAQMVLVDAQPSRKEGGSHSYRSAEESTTLANMRSTADLINDVPLRDRPPSGSTAASLSGWLSGQLAATAIEADVLRKHRRATPPTAQGEQHSSSGRMPTRLRSTVEGRNMTVGESDGDSHGGSGVETDRDAFEEWLATMADKMQHHHTRSAATEALNMQQQILQRKLNQATAQTPPSSGCVDGPSGGVEMRAANRRLVVQELRDRLEAVTSLLSNARCLFTTTELFDSAVDKRSFTGPLLRRPASSTSLQHPTRSVMVRHHQQSLLAPTRIADPTPPAAVTEALSDAEVGRLVQFLQGASNRANTATTTTAPSGNRRRKAPA